MICEVKPGYEIAFVSYATTQCLTGPPSKIVVVAAAYRQAKVFVHDCVDLIEKFGHPTVVKTDVNSVEVMVNNSSIVCVPIGTGVGRVPGYDASLVLVLSPEQVPADLLKDLHIIGGVRNG